VAHQVEQIPFDMPMNLIGIRLHLDRPAPRGVPLRYECHRQPVKKIGSMILADIALELHSLESVIGRSSIKAQVVDQATYRKQRGLGAARGSGR
jgi:hypothetical protein